MPSTAPSEIFGADLSASGSTRARMLAGILLTLAVSAAYLNSFAGALVYDDLPTIVDNASVRQLWPILTPAERGLPDAGRPLVHFSLALNYALGGADPRGYHVLNLAIHLCAALALFGCVRRTLTRTSIARDAVWIAFVGALLWAVHPLQTESVTYIVQRAESLMGFFFLLTIYFFIRSTEAVSPWRWQAPAVIACVLAVASKEVAVVVPPVVWLYDRVFVSGTFREALRRRAGFYAALASSWVVLAWLVVGAGGRGGTAGFDAPIGWWDYVRTQFFAVARYAWLAIRPWPLIFDYGVEPIGGGPRLVLCALVVSAMIALTVWMLVRRVALGFFGAWFLVILAPSSSVVPVATELIAEHRVYLSLAAIAVLFAIGAHRYFGRRGLFACVVVAVGLGWLTHERNADYRSELALWRDTVAKRPANARAHFNLGMAHFATGDFASATGELEATLRLKPNLLSAHRGLGHAYFRLGRFDEARREYERAAQLAPDDADLRSNLGTALAQLGRLAEAAAQYEVALRLRPDAAATHFFLGNTLARMGRFADAMTSYERALQLDPGFRRARENLERLRALPRDGNVTNKM